MRIFPSIRHVSTYGHPISTYSVWLAYTGGKDRMKIEMKLLSDLNMREWRRLETALK